MCVAAAPWWRGAQRGGAEALARGAARRLKARSSKAAVPTRAYWGAGVTAQRFQQHSEVAVQMPLLLLPGLQLLGQAAMMWSNTCLPGSKACSSFTMEINGSYRFIATPGAPVLDGFLPATAAGTPSHFLPSSGSDDGPLGPWQQLAVGGGDGGGGTTNCTVRYYPNADTFVFARMQGPGPAVAWPRFQFSREIDGQWGAISWVSGGAMVAGAAAPSLRRWAAAHPAGTANATLHGKPGGFGGPILLWHQPLSPSPSPSQQQGAAAAVGMVPLDYWDSNTLLVSPASPPRRYYREQRCDTESDDCWLSAGVLSPDIVPASGVWMSTALVGRPGLARVTRAMGSVLRNVHGSRRLRDAHVQALSYWTDNAAGYSFWSVPGNDLDLWGPIGPLYLKLHAEYMKAGIHFGAWESDNTFHRIPSIGSDGKTHGGWCFSDWTRWNLSLYPTGGKVAHGSNGWPAQMRALQDPAIQTTMAFTYYIYYLCHDNVWRNNASSPFRDAFLDVGPWRGISKPLNYGRGDQSVALLHPDRARAFYLEILGRARDEWGMSMLFKDDLADQGERITAQFPQRFGVKLFWLRAITGALSDLGMSMQACMTAPTEILASVQNMSALTNARVSGDGGLGVSSAEFGSVLTSMVGVGWSKDNVKTAGSGAFAHLQMLLATLSLGPVGITDRLSSRAPLPGPWSKPVWPANTTITSNISVVKAAISLNGSLLQPSYPLTPSDATLQRRAHGSGVHGWSVWATHTSVSTGSKGAEGICHHFTAVGFVDTTVSTEAEPIGNVGAANTARSNVCGWVPEADKTSGHNYHTLSQQSRAQCCAACFADTSMPCEAYVRDPVAGTCYLITGITSNATKRSTNREVGFTNRPVPPPTPQVLWPGQVLFPLVDFHATTNAPFSEPPSSFFRGGGTLAQHQYVYTDAAPIAPEGHHEIIGSSVRRAVAAAVSTSTGQACARWVTTGKPVPFRKHPSSAPTQINLSPRLPGARVILLGEAFKFAAVSTYRFGRVSVTSEGGLEIVLRGNVGETVMIRFVELDEAATLGICQARAVALKKNGETIVTLAPTA